MDGVPRHFHAVGIEKDNATNSTTDCLRTAPTGAPTEALNERIGVTVPRDYPAMRVFSLQGLELREPRAVLFDKHDGMHRGIDFDRDPC
ncbi:hypothetical protein ORS3428_27865 [Mesorhizobium sp. ORS 3428]|nr:hypothetical protein ORS3428_27865 [Mesorhizobium sp. ORS 3428]